MKNRYLKCLLALLQISHFFTYYWTIFYYWTICQRRNCDQLTDLVVLTAVFHLTKKTIKTIKICFAKKINKYKIKNAGMSKQVRLDFKKFNWTPLFYAGSPTILLWGGP